MSSQSSIEPQVLNYILHYPENFFNYQDVLKELHFTDPACLRVYKIIFELFSQNSQMPTEPEILWHIKQQQDYTDLSVMEQYAVQDQIEEMFAVSPTGATGDYIANFIAQKELTSLIDTIEDELENKTYRKSVPFLKTRIEALELLTSSSSTEEVLFPFSAENISKFTDSMDVLAGETLETPFPKYNLRSRGGLFRGDSSIVLGATNTGKTSFLVSLAVWYALRGTRVAYFAIDSAQNEMWERLYCRAVNKSLGENFTYADLQKSVAERIGENYNLILKFFPAATATPQDVFREYDKISYVLNEKTGNPDVDLVIIDYGDQLIPKRAYGEKRHELSSIFTDFAGFAQKKNNHVMSATQANRAALSANITTLEHMSESYAKSHPAANVYALCQTDAEYHCSPPKLRMAVLKTRRGPKNYIIPLCASYATQTFYEDPDFEGVIPILDSTGKGVVGKSKPKEVAAPKQSLLETKLAEAAKSLKSKPDAAT